MKLQTVFNSDLKLGTDAIATDKELAKQLQDALIRLGLLSAPSDGKFGPVSTAALLEFQDIFKKSYPVKKVSLEKKQLRKLLKYHQKKSLKSPLVILTFLKMI
jgi:Putative peptidoglycan binding domain